MACDKDYRTNVFYTIDNKSKKQPTIESVQRNKDIFEYYSGYEELYTEYSLLSGEYMELSNQIEIAAKQPLELRDYLEYLVIERLSIMERMDALDEKLKKYDRIEDDLLHGKTLIIYRGERR